MRWTCKLILCASVGILGFGPSWAQQPTTSQLIDALVPHSNFQNNAAPNFQDNVVVHGEDKPPSVDLQIPFEYNSDNLEPDAILILRRLGEALKDPKLEQYRFRIAGHTDATGSDEYNQILSEKRAKSVRDYLVYQYDLDASRLDVVGYGKTRLADPDHPTDAINRRVQVINIGR